MKQRRDLLKGLGVGTAWTTPIIQSIILPVHAQTSATTPAPPVKQFSGRYEAEVIIKYGPQGDDLSSDLPMFISMNVNSDNKTYTILARSANSATARGTLDKKHFSTRADADSPCFRDSESCPHISIHTVSFNGSIENNRATGNISGFGTTIDIYLEFAGSFDLPKVR